MDLVYDTSYGVEITNFIESLTPYIERSQVVNVDFSGAPHIQAIGELYKRFSVAAVVSESGGKLLERAFNDVSLIQVVYDEREYYGRISSLSPSKDVIEGYYKVSFEMYSEVVSK